MYKPWAQANKSHKLTEYSVPLDINNSLLE